MILKPHSIEGAKPEIKAAFEALEKVATAANWDLYPTAINEDGTIRAGLYRQLGTEVGDWSKLTVPASVKHEGDGIFSLAPAKPPK